MKISDAEWVKRYIRKFIKLGGEEFLDALVKDWVPTNAGKIMAFEKTVQKGYFVEVRFRISNTDVKLFVSLYNAETNYQMMRLKMVLLVKPNSKNLQKNSLILQANKESFMKVLDMINSFISSLNKLELISVFEDSSEIFIVEEDL